MATPGSVSTGGSAVEGFGAWSKPSGPGPVAPPAGKNPVEDSISTGSFNFDVTTPQGFVASMGGNVSEAVAYTEGINAALFGSHMTGTSQENQGGLPVISDIGRAVGRLPGIGAAVGGVGDILGGVGDTLKNTGDVVGGAFEQLTFGGPEQQAKLERQFQALPADIRREVEVAAEGKGYGEAAHLKYNAVNTWMKTEGQKLNPDLYPDQKASAVTLADHISSALGLVNETGRSTQRLVSGTPLFNGRERMDGIDAVIGGRAVYTPGLLGASPGVTPEEALAHTNWKSGVWSLDQALDYLHAADQGLSHDPLVQMVTYVALDPQVWGSIGAAGIAKLGITGARLAATGVTTAGKLRYGDVIARAAAELPALRGANIGREEGSRLFRIAQDFARVEKTAPGDFSPAAWDYIANVWGHGAKGFEVESLVQQAAMQGRNIRGINLLGRLAADEFTSNLVRMYAVPVNAVRDQQYLGQAAKTVRTIIDPFHLLGGSRVAHEAATDILAEAAPRLARQAHGQLAFAQVVEDMHAIKPGLGLEEHASYAANVAREVAAEQHIDAQIAAGPRALEQLVEGIKARRAEGGSLVNDIADASGERASRNVFDALKTRFVEVRPTVWGAHEMNDLAMRAHALWSGAGPSGPVTVQGWARHFAGKSEDYLALVHAWTFAGLSDKLLDAVGAAIREVGPAMAAELKLDRLYLMRRDRLTSAGVKGILNNLTDAAANLEVQQDIMRAAQAQYPELRFIPLRDVAPELSLDQWSGWLARELDDGRFPVQLLDNEIEALPDAIKEVDQLISGTFTLAYRPEDVAANLAGLTRGMDGRLVRAYAPWVDRVGTGAVKSRGTFASEHNLLGLPLVGNKVGKPIDYIEAGLKTATSMVASEVIAIRASQRFQSLASEKYGLSAIESRPLIEAVQYAAGTRELTVRGMTASNMQEAVRQLLPRGSKMTPADILNLVLEAYEGDLRYVGLTQKFTGRAKALFGRSGSNFAGQVSENLYQKIRFQYNLVFQGQERIEPWVLSAQRGVMPVFGTAMTDQARYEATLFQNLRNSGLMRAASVDTAEWSSYVVAGSDIRAILAHESDPTFFGQLRDVRGAKFTAMNETAAASSAVKIREVLDREMPGFLDRFIEYDSQRMGRLVSDREAIAHWMNEGGLTHEIVIPDVVNPGDGIKAFGPTIRVGEMMRPVDFGEVRAIDLDFWAARIGAVDNDGRILTTQDELRRALADGGRSGITDDGIRTMLLQHGAHPTQADRAVTALNFSWPQFIGDLQRAYNLDRAEARVVEDFLARAASMRDLGPVDFVSQVFSPTIAGGSQATVGQLGAAIAVMRSGRPGTAPDLARLAAPFEAGARAGTREMLVEQLATVFAAHLDPSSKWALLQAFQPELRQAVLDGTIRTDLQSIERMWSEGADSTLAQQLMGYLDASAGDYYEANLPRTLAEYAERFPGGKGSVTSSAGVKLKYNAVVGPGLSAAPEGLRDTIVGVMGRIQAEFPEVNIAHVDIRSIADLTPGNDGAIAEMLGGKTGKAAIVFDPKHFGDDWEEVWQLNVLEDNATARNTTFTNHEFPDGPRLQRRSNPGVTYSADPTMAGAVRHEMAHAIDRHMRRFGRQPREERFAEYTEFLDRFEESPANMALSEYSMVNMDEGAAELISLILDPYVDFTKYDRPIPARVGPNPFDDLPPASDTEYWRDFPASERPDYVPTPVEGAPETVEEAALELVDILQRNGMMRVAPPVTSDPDVVRAARMFGRFTTEAVRDGLLRGTDSAYASLLNDIARIPTADAVPYNLTHGLMVQQVEDAMVRGAEDAFRLQFFAQNRSWAERTINHPFFGIYPASYMWGKIAPELARFMMSSPFGVRTGAASYIARDMAVQIAARQELDPEFDKMMNGVGKSDIGWFLGYLLPSLPWDIGGGAATWTRDLAQQGLDNQARVEAGLPPKALNLGSPIRKVTDYVSPGRQVEQVMRPLGELGQVITPQADQKTAPARNFVPANPDEVRALELGPTLADEMQNLQDLLGQR